MSETRNVGRYYFETFFKLDKINKTWFSKLDLCRNSIVTISRLRANYYSLPATLARKNFIESGECLHCGFLRSVLFQHPLQGWNSIKKRKNYVSYHPPWGRRSFSMERQQETVTRPCVVLVVLFLIFCSCKLWWVMKTKEDKKRKRRKGFWTFVWTLGGVRVSSDTGSSSVLKKLFFYILK